MYAEVPLPSVIMPLTSTMGALPSTGALFYIQAKFDGLSYAIRRTLLASKKKVPRKQRS
jgi:hypothetical protein